MSGIRRYSVDCCSGRDLTSCEKGKENVRVLNASTDLPSLSGNESVSSESVLFYKYKVKAGSTDVGLVVRRALLMNIREKYLVNFL
jgi:hypothetical protein